MIYDNKYIHIDILCFYKNNQKWLFFTMMGVKGLMNIYCGIK